MSALFEIDLGSNKPIYEQLVNQVKEQVLRGFLQKGDAMPSIRAVSKAVLVNSNTVARAYQELERLGLIETVVGRGTFVKGTPTPRIDEEKSQALFSQIKTPLMELKLMGMADEAIVEGVQRLLYDLKEDGL